MIRPHRLLTLISGFATAISVATVKGDEPNSQDKAFVYQATSGGMLEVRLGLYASANAASADVKKFGEHMVGDHRKANEQLKGLKTQQPIETPMAMNQADQQTLDRLEKLSGPDFDKAYIEQMIEDHKQDIAAFEKEIRDGSDSIIVAFAERTLPVLKHHLEMAQAMSQK